MVLKANNLQDHPDNTYRKRFPDQDQRLGRSPSTAIVRPQGVFLCLTMVTRRTPHGRKVRSIGKSPRTNDRQAREER